MKLKFRSWRLLALIMLLICFHESIANSFFQDDIDSISDTKSTSPNIVFADAKVKALCVHNWDINGDGELSEAEAAAVTSLNYVFYNDSTITSFDEFRYFIGVQYLNTYEFRGCNALTSIILPNSVTSIDYAFYECNSLINVAIPNSITEIGERAFSGCSKLTSIDIPNSVITIGYNAFGNCNNLTSVTIPNSVTLIDEFAFSGCSSLTTVTIPNSIDSIGRCAFYGCDALNDVFSYIEDPSGIAMGSSVFQGNPTNYANRSLHVPLGSLSAYLAIIDWKAYFGHILEIGGSSSSIIVFADAKVKALCVQNWDTNGDGELSESEAAAVTSLNYVFRNKTEITSFNELRFFTNLRSISDRAFFCCYNLTSVIIPNAVTSISFSAFFSCHNLTDLEIPNSVKTIGENAFNGSGLINLIIPNSVTSIGEGAYMNCSKLSSIIIGNSVVSIGKNAFHSCSGLKNMTVDNGNIKYDSRDNCNAIIETATNTLIAGCENTTIPSSVTTIGYNAFFGCTALDSVAIPSSVNSIINNAFGNCPGINSITVDGGNLEYDSRNNCNAIIETATNTLITGCKSTIIPNTVTAIGPGAFHRCSSLTSINIPESVTSIGNTTFWGCDELTDVYSEIKAPSLVTMGANVFYLASANYSNRTLHVPVGSLPAYNADTNWSDYFDQIVEIGASPNIVFEDSRVKAICVQLWDQNGDGELSESEAAAVTSLNNVFQGNSNITSFKEFRYFTSVTSIGESEFSECYMMKNIMIPNSVTQIGRLAFDGCSSLKSVIIPDKVTSINAMTFVKCTSLTSISIPNSVTYIGSQAFYLCSNLTSVIIPNSVTMIDKYAFQRCSSLTSITIGSSVTSIGYHAFYECDNISEVISKSINPPTLSEWFCFTSPVYRNAKLLVPYNSLEEYKNATYWENFSHIYGTNNDNNILAEELTLDITNKELEIDESFTISVTISPSIVANNTVSWSSSNTNIAMVDNGGIVIAISAGSVIIKATTTDGTNISASCNVTVKKRLVNSILLNKTSTTIYVGDTEQLTATLSPSDASDTTLTWTSSNTNIATVNNDGVITAISAGAAIITAKTNDGSNLSATCTVTVKNVLATSISLNETDVSIFTGNTLQLNASVLPTTTSNPSVTWSSSNTSIATVSTSGLVTAKSKGNAVITARTADGSNLSATCNVRVKQLATSISLNKTSETLYMGNTLQLVATVYPSTTSDKSVSWSSSNTAVATVSSDGLVTPKSTGTATITVRTEDGSNLTAQCIVTVKQFATSISLNETVVTIYTGDTFQLSATVLPSTTSNTSVTWSSSNTSVATVSSTGLVTAKSTGEAVITAKTADGSSLSASCKVTVKRLATSISLNKTSATLYLDQTIQLSATVSPSDATDKSVIWSSSDNNIATVSSTGLVTAIMPGIATITATTADGSDLSATCEITVKAYVTSLALDPSEATILEGDTITLSPIILPSYATNQSLNWSLSNTSVVSVNNGVVVGRSGGEATITARTSDGSNLSASCKVTVIPNFDISAPDLSHIRGSANNIFDLTIDLANRYEITGMQFDVQFPDGVKIAKDVNDEYDISLDNYRKSRNHTVTASQIGNNSYRILVSSATANILKGNSGTVLHIMIEIPISHVSGNKQIRYTNIILSEPDETRHTLPAKTSMISYYYLEGDANADVSVDVADYVITGNYILQNSPEGFWRDAANVDHNSTVDVNDLTGITNIALGRREGGVRQMPALQASEEDKDIELTAVPLQIQAGQTKTLNLSLEGNYAFAGFQMDLQLPKGIKLVDASLADESSGLSIATAELPDGSIRLLASSFSLKNLVVNNTTFLKLTVMAEDGFNGNDFITLDNIKFSERNMLLHTVENVVIPVGNNVSGLNKIYSEIRIYADGKNIIIDSPESGTAQVVTIAGITQARVILPGHNVIPMEDSGLYIVTLNGTTAKLYLK